MPLTLDLSEDVLQIIRWKGNDMTHIRFKNLDKSEMLQMSVTERVEALVEKFPDLSESKIQVTLEMENSPHKPGPDLFRVKFHLTCGRYDGITVEKANSDLYIALAEVTDRMLEKLSRFGDRIRVKEREKARRITGRRLREFIECVTWSSRSRVEG